MSLHLERTHPGLSSKVDELPVFSPLTKDKTEAFNCQYCKCVAISVDSLRYHWTMVHKENFASFLYENTEICSEFEYECAWCKRRDSADGLARHTRASHPEHKFLVSPVTIPKYKCAECKLSYNSVEILRRHFNLDHPSRMFKFVTLNSPKTFASTEKKTASGPDDEEKSNKNVSYKCFNCHFVSTLFAPMVKHVQRHVTFGCNGCSQTFVSSFEMRRHATKMHPGADSQPVVLKGSADDLHHAKRKVIVVCKSGKKRTITEEEVLLAEREEGLVAATQDKPQLLTPPAKMTARKSTGSSRKRPTASDEPQDKPQLLTPPVKMTARKSTGLSRKRLPAADEPQDKPQLLTAPTKMTARKSTGSSRKRPPAADKPQDKPQLLKPLAKMTARKSTGSSRKRPPSADEPLSAWPMADFPKAKNITYNDVNVNVASGGKNIRFPVEKIKKIFDFEGELGLEPDDMQST